MLIPVLLSLSTVARAASADARAEEIARTQPRVLAQFEALRSEIDLIKDPDRRRDLRELVDGPKLRVLERRAAEADILAKLKAAGLLASDARTLLPGSAAAFIASPAGVWHGHHSYPGGLVDHTLFNVRSGLSLAAVYRKNYGVPVDEDLVRAAAVMHDMAKPATLRWRDDGTLPAVEPQVAGTGLHHILGVAEALLRGWPPRLVVCVASAHNPPKPGEDLEKLLGYLRAAAIIAGKEYAQAGLAADGKSLAQPPTLEAFITHLDDHDYVLTETSIRAAEARINESDPWRRDEQFARETDLAIYLRP